MQTSPENGTEPAELFSPTWTGRNLPDDIKAKWTTYCGAVRKIDRPLYNSYFENRWAKHKDPDSHYSVQAEYRGGWLFLWVAGPHQKDRFNLEILPRFRKLQFCPMRAMKVADPKGQWRADNVQEWLERYADGHAKVNAALDVCNEMTHEARQAEAAGGKPPLPASYWRKLTRLGEAILKREIERGQLP